MEASNAELKEKQRLSHKVELSTITNLVGNIYGATNLVEWKKQRQQINDEACTIYQVGYEYAKLNKYRNKCYFS